jgi:hypothetical protein
MERPPGITALGSISAVVGILMLAGGTWLLLVSIHAHPAQTWGLNYFLGAFAVILMLFSIPQIVVGVGLLRMKNWARILALLGSATNIVALVFQLKLAMILPVLSLYLIVRAVLDVWLLVYLLSPRVKQAFGATGI